MLDRRTVELVLISLAAAFCGGLARALQFTGAFGAVAALVAPVGHDAPLTVRCGKPRPLVRSGGSGRLDGFPLLGRSAL